MLSQQKRGSHVSPSLCTTLVRDRVPSWVSLEHPQPSAGAGSPQAGGSSSDLRTGVVRSCWNLHEPH